MSQNPINLGARFLLEVAALIAVGMWGWQKPEGNMRYVLIVLLLVLLAALWGVFRVPKYPGTPPVQVSGGVRLLIEAFVFGSAVAALYDLEQLCNSLVLAGILVVHYLASYDRIVWLLRQ